MQVCQTVVQKYLIPGNMNNNYRYRLIFLWAMSWETNGSTWTRVSSQWLRKKVSAKSTLLRHIKWNLALILDSHDKAVTEPVTERPSENETKAVLWWKTLNYTINDRKRQVNWSWSISNIPSRSTSKSKRKMSAVIWVPKKSKETVSHVKSLKKLRNVSFLQWVLQSEPNRSLPIASFATNLPIRFLRNCPPTPPLSQN